MDFKEKIEKSLKNIKNIKGKTSKTNKTKKDSIINSMFLNSSKNKSVKKQTKKSQSTNLDFKKVSQSLLDARNTYKINIVNNNEEKSLSILFEDIRLISLNEIFKYLQKEKLKFAVFKYKKECHDLISFVLEQNKDKITFFNDKPVKITYFRKSSRYIDHDSFIASFKFFLDGLVENKILPDDNPNFIDDIKHFQSKKKKNEKSLLGIRIEEINSSSLKDDYNPYLEWGFFEKMQIIENKEDLDNSY